MSNQTKQLESINKQNDAIYSSLIARNIEFTRNVIADETEDASKLLLLQEENKRLKEVVAANKPRPVEVEVKVKVKVEVKVEAKVETAKKVKKEEDKDKDEEEDDVEDETKKYECTFNMEDMKRAFFGDDLVTFEKIFKEQQENGNLKCYYGDYKRDSDYDGSQEFIARNLVRGFVKQFEDYRKYTMACFRCSVRGEKQYHYSSMWLTNVKEPLVDLITDEDFNLVESTSDVSCALFLEQIKKTMGGSEFENSLLAEMYLH